MMRFYVCALLAMNFACACNSAQQHVAGNNTASAQKEMDPSTVVAEIGEQKITLHELDEHVAAQLKELEEQRFQTRKQGLDQLINQRLTQHEAAKAGVTEEQYLKDTIEAKVAKPTEEEVSKFFHQNTAQLPPGAKLEDYRDKIVNFMSHQAHGEKAKEVFNDMRKNNHVVIHLAAPPKPRVQVEAQGPSKGPDNAKVTIVEFSDFECPFCSRARDIVAKVEQKYEGKIKLVFRQFPLSFHQHAKKAAEAALCAHAQGKFWQMHDAMFANQQKLAVDDLKETANSIGLDKQKFVDCLDHSEQSKAVENDILAATKVGVSGTPAFFINGILLSGAQPIEAFESIIDAELAAH